MKTWEGAASTMGAAEALEILEGKTLFFGHQSVGNNILDGLADVLASEGLGGKLALKRGSDRLEGSGFHDAEIGENRDPLGKMKDFEARLAAAEGKADAAFMKLCYVDILGATDVAAVFAAYWETVSRIQAAHPDLKLLHFTVPLTTPESGAKASLKRMLGRSVDVDNRARQAYNALLRGAFGPTGRLFDLALLEATDEAGSYRDYSLKGETYIALRPEWAADEGHLNASGSRRVAHALLSFLAGALK